MKRIKRIKIILVSALISGIMVLVASTAVAEQPQTSIGENVYNPINQQLNPSSNGNYPFPFSNEKVLRDGNYLFRDEYSESTLQYITKKKSTVTDHTMLITDTESFNDASYNTSPKLMLSCVKQGFYVVGRIRKTSHKEQNLSHVSSSLLFPNLLQEANINTFPARTHFLSYKEYSYGLMPLSNLSSIQHLSNAAPEGFVKFESTTSEEEKPSAITPLIKWLCWVCRMIFVGTDKDGDIDAYGVTFVTAD